MGVVMDEHGGRLPPPGVAISGEQCAQLAQQYIRRRQCVSGGASRTNRRALSAARADICIDHNVIAGRCDRSGWAEVEAARAADDLRARVGAEIVGEGDVARLVEAADEISCLEHRLDHGRRIAGIGAQVAIAQIGCGEKRRATGDVEHKIAARHCAVAGRSEIQRAARRRRWLGVAIDGELERAEIPLGRAD